jgi:hypothetical protein
MSRPRAWLASALAAMAVVAGPVAGQRDGTYQDRFDIAGCRHVDTGRSAYFVLEPGYQLVLEGGGERLAITVLASTRDVAGVTTRIVEERQWERGELREVARNFVALCERTGDVHYFGEEVDIFEKGRAVRHDGSWLAGRDGQRAGLLMPGKPGVGMRYHQEVAPGIAMDRAEVLSVDETCKVPAGTFRRCLKVRESSSLEPGASGLKYHAPGIGLVQDGKLRLVRYGVVAAR